MPWQALLPERSTGRPVLRVCSPRQLLDCLPLSARGEWVIGREETCALPVVDPSVSRRHARISSRPEGGFWVEDLGSTNGTALNQQPIANGVFSLGDQLQVGNVLLELDMMPAEGLSMMEAASRRARALPHPEHPGWHAAGTPLDTFGFSGASAALIVTLEGVDAPREAEASALLALSRMLLLPLGAADVPLLLAAPSFCVLRPHPDPDPLHALAFSIGQLVHSYNWRRAGNERRRTVHVSTLFAASPDELAHLSGLSLSGDRAPATHAP